MLGEKASIYFVVLWIYVMVWGNQRYDKIVQHFHSVAESMFKSVCEKVVSVSKRNEKKMLKMGEPKLI